MNGFQRSDEARSRARARAGLLLVALTFLLAVGASRAIGLAAAGGKTDRLKGTPAKYHLPIVFRRPPPGVPPRERPIYISEVLYDPEVNEPNGEWIEIYNPGRYRMDLSGFKIGDEETPGEVEGMLRFPKGAAIWPGQIVIIANEAATFFSQYGFKPDFEMHDSDPTVPTLIKYAAWSGGNIELVNTSDEVLLLDPGDRVHDAVSWGSSTFAFDPAAPDVPAGHSLERVPAGGDTDSAADWRDQPSPAPGEIDLSTPTPGPAPTATADTSVTPGPSPTPTMGPSPTATLSPTPFAGTILISEVLYDPEAPEPQREWIEVFNAGAEAVALQPFKIGDEETVGGGEGMFQFPAGAVLGAGDAVIVANTAVEFAAAYGFAPDFEVLDSDPAVPDMQKYGAWAGGSLILGNTGDEILLLDGGDQVTDSVSWGSSTFSFDPAAPDVPEGYSLERRPADQDTDAATDWIAQANPDPGQVSLDPPPSPTPALSASPTSPSATSTAAPSSTPEPTATLSPTATLPDPTPTATVSPPPGVTPTPSSTTGPSETPAPAAPLLIGEVFYDTPGTDSQEEWIEIYNPSGQAVDLSGYKIGDEETAGGGEGMFEFPAGAVLAPGDRIVVALQATGFAALYGFSPDYEVQDTDPAVPDLQPYAVWAGGTIAMGNTGDEVLLLNGADQVIDAVTYENGSFPGVTPHPGVSTGHSLERSPADQDTDDCAADFIDQPVPNPSL